MPDVHRVEAQLVKAELGYGVGVEDLGRSCLGVVSRAQGSGLGASASTASGGWWTGGGG